MHEVPSTPCTSSVKRTAGTLDEEIVIKLSKPLSNMVGELADS
jgi:hypothetical protein